MQENIVYLIYNINKLLRRLGRVCPRYKENALTEKIIDFVRELIGNDYWTTVLISIIPIVELRGAIPAAMNMGINAFASFALAWAGSALVAPILLLILRPVLDWMKKCKPFASLAHAVESGFKSKAMKVVGDAGGELTVEQAKKLERKKMLGVYLFVAFPIPLTGVWTGSAVATFLDIPFFKSLAMVWLGNLTAGGIVTVLAVLLKAHMNTVLDIFFVIVILVLLFYIITLTVKMVKNKKAKAAEVAEAAEIVKDAASEENAETVFDSDDSDRAQVVEDGDKTDAQAEEYTSRTSTNEKEE